MYHIAQHGEFNIEDLEESKDFIDLTISEYVYLSCVESLKPTVVVKNLHCKIIYSEGTLTIDMRKEGNILLNIKHEIRKILSLPVLKMMNPMKVSLNHSQSALRGWVYLIFLHLEYILTCSEKELTSIEPSDASSDSVYGTQK